MKDLDICKRIAEIDGEHITEVQHSDGTWLRTGYCEEYNPLTNDALCFRLMVKYEVEAYPLVKGVNGKHLAISRVFNGCDDFIEFRGYGETLNKAICLAIIELHKEK